MTALTLHAGDSRILDVTVQTIDGLPMDLSGATVEWVVLCAWTGDTALSKSTANGITLTDATAGRLEILLTSADTAGLAGDHRMKARVTDGSGNRTTILDNSLYIAADAFA